MSFFHYAVVILFQIHWFSIFNSFMMVIFLVGLVSMILMRTLRKDYARYSKEDDIDDMEKDLGDEYGWKQVIGYSIQSEYYIVDLFYTSSNDISKLSNITCTFRSMEMFSGQHQIVSYSLLSLELDIKFVQ